MYAMKHYVFSLCMLFALSLLFACKNEEQVRNNNTHNPNEPVTLTSFSPLEGGARDQILLDGKNFGSDTSQIKVYFNNTRAAVVSSSGDRIYAIVPRLPGDDPVIKVVIGDQEVSYDGTFTYVAQAQVTTVTGSGDREFVPGTLDQAHVCAKYLELDAEGNLL